MMHNVQVGLKAGLLAGLVYSALVALLVTRVGEEALIERHRLALWELVGLYAIGGVLGGIIWGLLRNLNGSLLGAMVNGYLAALPAFFLTSLVMVPRLGYGDGALSTVILVALLSAGAGALAGAFCRLYFDGDRALPLDDL